VSDWFTPPDPETTSALMNGAAGAVVAALLRRRKTLSWWITAICVGVLCAVTVGKPLSELLGMDLGAACAMLGLTGVPLANRMIRWAETAPLDDLTKVPEVKEEDG